MPGGGRSPQTSKAATSNFCDCCSRCFRGNSPGTPAAASRSTSSCPRELHFPKGPPKSYTPQRPTFPQGLHSPKGHTSWAHSPIFQRFFHAIFKSDQMFRDSRPNDSDVLRQGGRWESLHNRFGKRFIHHDLFSADHAFSSLRRRRRLCVQHAHSWQHHLLLPFNSCFTTAARARKAFSTSFLFSSVFMETISTRVHAFSSVFSRSTESFVAIHTTSLTLISGPCMLEQDK